ncbi:hypothetical protein QPK32_20540, partial [Massilia sp. YIM B02763]|uniref:hypothetical protein n=1 Tax=Massilia sp. YIM B02763 TaxID=3050130 RepID=UPI0025B6F63A
PPLSVVCAIAGAAAATRAPLATMHEIAHGNDFNLNVMKTSPSWITLNGFTISFSVFTGLPWEVNRLDQL